MHKISFIFLISSLVLFSCGKKPSQEKAITTTEEYSINYAQGFKVVKAEEYTQIEIRNPWDTTTLLQRYILVNRDKELPSSLPTGVIVRTPVTTAAITSTVQCSTLEELNSLNIVTGVCDAEYMKSNYIQTGLSSGKIKDLGVASNPNSEAIILLSPEVIFSDPVTGQSQGNMEKTKIAIIQTPDYTEPHPLGRAEWIRFYSLFLEKEQLADSLFNITVNNYNEIKSKVMATAYHPTVFTDTRYQGSWNMAGGKSFMATFYADAGANYLWNDNESTTFMPLSFEAVLDKAGDGDIWIIRYHAESELTYAGLEKEYKPYSYFKAFKEKNIYGCNAKYTSYFEDLPIHPDYILQDLAYVFHPDLFPDYTPRYYKKLKD